jgi:zinc protease
VLEHMMFRGSSRFASEEHARKINDVGGHCNAFTAEDVTAYINSVPKECLDMALELEADRMASLTLDAAILETERKVIIEEYHTYMNNPVAKAFLEFRRTFYRDHPYAISPLGELADIQLVSQLSCREYYERHYSPDNAIVVIAGDIDSADRVREKVERCFGNIAARGGERRGNSHLAPAPTPALEQGSTWMKRVVEFDVPMLLVGHPGPASASSDALALEILQMIVSQGESSRLHREVVRKKSLAVMAGGMNHFLKLSGMTLFFAAFTPDVPVRRIEAALNAEIAAALSGGISEKEIEKIRNTTLTNRAFELYSAEHICQRLGYSETVEGDFHKWIERMKELEHIDKEEVCGVARRYWDPGTRHTLFLKPKKTRPMLFIAGLARKLMPRRGR